MSEAPFNPNSRVILSSDPVENAAADKMAAIASGEEDNDFSWAEEMDCRRAAGRALANRYSFVVAYDEDAGFYAQFTNKRTLLETGWAEDTTPPIGHLLPGCGEFMEATFGLPGDIQSPTDAVLYLQDIGFFWDAGWQTDYSSSEETAGIIADLKNLEQPRPVAVKPPSGPQPG